MKKIEDYAAKIRSFYQTASGFVPSERLNAVTDIQIDHRFTKNSEGNSEYQSAETLMKRLDSGQQQMVQQLMQQVLMYFGMHIQHYQTFMLGHMNLDTIKIAEYFC